MTYYVIRFQQDGVPTTYWNGTNPEVIPQARSTDIAMDAVAFSNRASAEAVIRGVLHSFGEAIAVELP